MAQDEETTIAKMLKHILTLTRHTYVEKTEKELYLDVEDYCPSSEDELLDALRKDIYGDRESFEEFPFQITSEEEKYQYWCCGHWRNPLSLVPHVRERHT